MVFAIHQHESALGIHMSIPSGTPLPTPSLSHILDCQRAPALGSLLYTANSHWPSILHMVMYMFQCYSLRSFHLIPQSLCPKYVLYVHVSFAALYVGSSVLTVLSC